jgi:sterol desaturase/sphingolipid hydroxylase (fatty acid hydroxylase superfamily)
MLNELKSSITLLEYYLTWLIKLSSGSLASYVLIIFFMFLVVLELNSPREKLSITKVQSSYLSNIKLFVFNSLIISLLSIPSLLLLASHYADKGLLNAISNPIEKAAISFLAMDLMLYCLHKACHHVDCLWMLHKVHHNDPYLNVTTAFRLHFLEIMLIISMKALLVLVLGIEKTYLLANELVITFFIMLHHSNIVLLAEELWGWIIITPYLHRVHHSTLRHEHDRNYGAVLSLWDRLFWTLADLKPKEIGVKGYVSQDFIDLISCGLTIKDKEPSIQTANLDQMIAEAAYYKAEKRGFYPGHDLQDWLDAKREIID